MVDTCIGPYRIVREIAEDRFGKLFRAVDPERKRQVVLKSLRPDAARRPEVVSRLYSEAETLALLNHPHIARIFGFLRLNDRLYLVMEFVEGESLAAILKEKHRLDPNIVVAFFHQIFSAVRYAHELGVVHGDLTPSNIMVSSFAQIKILNFAIPAILGNLDLDGRPDATSTGYLSPEQLRGEKVDARSDIYSLGVLIYRLIVGKLPFDMQGEVSGSAQESFTPPSQLVANCPDWLDGFMQRALDSNVSERFQSISAMSCALGIPGESRAPSASLKRGRRPLEPSITSVSHEPAKSSAQKKRPLPVRSHGRFGSLKGRLNRLSDSGWKQYVVLAVLLVSAMIETFIFGGANTLFGPDSKPLPASRIETADSPVEPPAPSPAATNEQDVVGVSRASEAEPEPQSEVVKPLNRASRTIEKSNAKPNPPADNLYLEALNSKRTVTYRSNAESDRPVLQELRTSEPSPPRRNAENTPVKPQLNVKWEN